MKKKKVIHLAEEYPCSHCGFVEVLCGADDIFEESADEDWTITDEKVTCKKCKKEMEPTPTKNPVRVGKKSK